MNYEKAIDYIHSTYKFGIKLGLDNMKNLLSIMDNPQDGLKYIHVAGTNGKGSVCSFIANILIRAGYKVGLYTSPYINKFEERMQINNENIKEEELAEITTYVKEKVDEVLLAGKHHPTEFEIVTAIAFRYFSIKKCDIVVLEVGLGGRFDSTNIISNSEVSVINVIDFDHMDRLGNTLEEIAYEKAGIIKDNGNVVLYNQKDEVNFLIKKVCDEKKANLRMVTFNYHNLRRKLGKQVFSYNGYKDIEITLNGQYQIYNSIMAINVVEILVDKKYNIEKRHIYEGLQGARWPGRFEVVSLKPYIILDGSHNPQGISSLRDSINELFNKNKKAFIMSVMKDKDYAGMVKEISRIADMFVLVNSSNERALKTEALADEIKKYCNNIVVSDTIDNAMRIALDYVSIDGLVCVTGTFSIISEARDVLNYYKI